jgi:hypothetical protein
MDAFGARFPVLHFFTQNDCAPFGDNYLQTPASLSADWEILHEALLIKFFQCPRSAAGENSPSMYKAP